MRKDKFREKNPARKLRTGNTPQRVVLVAVSFYQYKDRASDSWKKNLTRFSIPLVIVVTHILRYNQSVFVAIFIPIIKTARPALSTIHLIRADVLRITYCLEKLNPDNDVYLSSTEIKGAQTEDTATTVTIIDHTSAKVDSEKNPISKAIAM